MNKQRLASMLIVVALAMLTVAGCGPKESRQAAALSWSGGQITGTPFYVRRMETVTIHYTPPTTPEKVELLGTLSNRILTGYKGWGRLSPSERVDVWVLPTGTTSVEGFQWLLENQRAQAVSPNVVVIREEAIPASEVDLFAMQLNGFPEALAVAVTQAEDSPVYKVAWLHEGMGNLFVNAWVNFPASVYARNAFMYIQRNQKPWTAKEIVDRLNNPYTAPARGNKGPYPPGYRQAAAALSGLMVDRWGVDWPEVYQRSIDQLAPAEALKWAMGVSDDQKAMDEFENRMAAAIEEQFRAGSGRAGFQVPPTLATRGLNRIQPQPIPGKGAGPAMMPTYVLDVDWDPITETLTGEEEVTWVNNRSGAVDRLYFTVWGNNDSSRWFGGESTVESVTVGGNPVTFSLRQMDLEIPLEKPVQPGESVTVRLTFKNQLGKIGFRPPRPGQLPLVASTEPEKVNPTLLEAFYPTLGVLDDKGWQLVSSPSGDFGEPGIHHVRITAPKGILVEQLTQAYKPVPPVKVSEDGGRALYEFKVDGVSSWRGAIHPLKKGTPK